MANVAYICKGVDHREPFSRINASRIFQIEDRLRKTIDLPKSVQAERFRMQVLGEVEEDPDFEGLIHQYLEDLQALVDQTINQCGKMKVFYLGDLKPHNYDLKAKLFHLGDTVSEDEVKHLLRSACTQGRDEVTLINLRNVREITVSIGIDRQEVEKDLQAIQTFGETIAAWMTLSYEIIVVREGS